MKVIPGMCCTKLDIYVFMDFPVFIPWTHQIKVIPGMCRAKLDIYVFIDFPVFIPWMHKMKVIPGMCRANLYIYVLFDFPVFISNLARHIPEITFIWCVHGINTGKSIKT
jgi:hypothetical protein